MFVRRLEHVNIRTRFFDETVRFYTDVLGLRVGPRPGVQPGAWLFDPTGVAVIHLSPVDPNDPEQIEYLNEYLGARDIDSLHGSGAIDHVAFAAEGFADFRAHFRGKGVAFRERKTVAGVDQLFVEDPNGISIELNFHP